MPRASVPKSPKITLDDAQKVGYNFFQDRWEGDEAYPQARSVALYFQQQGWASNVHEGKADSWEKGKKTNLVYFKVWLKHPIDDDLYAWWAPVAAEWLDPPKVDELTWFEFVRPKADKK